MFDWFKNKGKEPTNVVPFPVKDKEMPSKVVPPPLPEKSSEVCYRIGMTNDNRITLQMGYSEVTMNRRGVDNLIQQLAVFRDQLQIENDDE